MRSALVLGVLLVAGVARAQPGDWAPKRDPFDPNVVARWKQLLERDPYDATALAKLEQLYRGFRTLDALEAEFAQQGGAPALIARARMHAERKDDAGALALYQQAVALAPDDARGWLAIGGLAHVAPGKSPEQTKALARDAYERALAAQPQPALVAQALRALAALSVDPEPYYVRLLALAPDDAELWIARGDALFSAVHAEAALESYTAAERLLAARPQRRIDVIARRGLALDRLGDDRGALNEYRRAIAAAPPSYYLTTELVGRIVDAYRRRHALPELAERFERDWPAAHRTFDQWHTLGSLYSEIGDADHAIAALDHATRLAPWETDVQRHLITLYDGADRHAKALAQYDAAIRGAPGDLRLQLELAERTFPGDHARALAMLRRATATAARDPSLLDAIAKLYTKLEALPEARDVREKIAKLEPDDEDQWLALAQSYLDGDDGDAALAAWRRVARQQPGALARLGEMFLDNNDLPHALEVLDESIALDKLNPLPWKLRAWVYSALGNYDAALDNAMHELKLVPPDRIERSVARHHVIQILGQTRISFEDETSETWQRQTAQWLEQFMRTPPEIEAGYLLIDAYQSAGCAFTDPVCGDLISVTERLAQLVPDDPDVLVAKIRMERSRGHLDRVAPDMQRLAALDPKRAQLLQRQLDRSLVYDGGGGLEDPFPDTHTGPFVVAPGHDRFDLDAVMGIGATMHGNMGSSLTLGVAAGYALADRVAATMRFDWSERGGIAAAPQTLGAGFGAAVRVFDSRIAGVAVHAGERLEVRLGDIPMRTWDRAGLAVETGAQLLLHNAPVGMGLRVEQWIVGSAYDTRAVLDFTVQIH